MATIQDNDKNAPRIIEKEDATLLYDAAVVVTLQRIHEYLKANIEAFQERSAGACVALSLPGLGVLSGMEQQQFHLQQRVQGENLEVVLSFLLVREENAEFLIPHESKSEQELVRSLRREGIRVIGSRVLGSTKGAQQLKIEIVPEIPVSFRFESDSERGILSLTIHNFDALGVNCYLIQPEQVDAEFLNQLGRLISRRHNVFLQNAEAAAHSDLMESGFAASDISGGGLSVTGGAQAEIIDFDPITLTGKREIVLSYRDMTFSFDRHRPDCHFGRKFPAEILIRSRYVSRAHATLRFIDKQFIFEDHSANGTFIKIGSNTVTFLHHEKLRLKGNGVISLGVSIASEKRDLIFFEVT